MHFGKLDRIIIDDVDWHCEATDDFGHVLVAAHDPKIRRGFTHGQMREKAQQPDFQHDRNWYDKAAVANRMHVEAESFNQLSYEERQLCFWKEDFVIELENLQKIDSSVTLGDGPLTEAIKVIDVVLRRRTSAIIDQGRRRRGGRRKEFFDPPGVKSLRDWRNMYIEADRDPLCFASLLHRSGNRTDRMTDEQNKFLRKYARKYPTMKEPSVNGLLKEMRDEINVLNEERAENDQIRVPCWQRLNKEIESIGGFANTAGRAGLDDAREEYGHISEGMKGVTRPLQHVEIDHWTVQLQTILVWSGAWEKLNLHERRKLRKIRMTLGVAICRLTRVVIGMILTETANVEATIRLVEMAVVDKIKFGEFAGARTPYDISGTGETFFHDGGTALNNLAVRTIFRDLRVGFHIAPAGLAHLRATVERMFRSIDQELLVWFEGRTFSGISEKGDYDAQKATGTTVDELGRALVRFAVDCYHNRPVKALGHRTRREYFLEMTKKRGVAPSPDSTKQRNVFGTDYVRVLTAGGIRFLGIQYRSKELHQIFMNTKSKEKNSGKNKKRLQFTVRIHHANLGAISVRIGDRQLLTVKGPNEFNNVDVETWIGGEELLRKRGQHMEKITAALRVDAMREFEELAQTARKRADISHVPTSKNRVLAAERLIMAFANFPDEETIDPEGDLYDDAIDVPPGDPAATTPPVASKRAKTAKRRAPRRPRRPARSRRPRTWIVKG
jgi:putative transposase